MAASIIVGEGGLLCSSLAPIGIGGAVVFGCYYIWKTKTNYIVNDEILFKKAMKHLDNTIDKH